MAFDIKPNDRFLQEQRTFYRTSVPKDEIRGAMIVKRARHDNLSAGDEIVVQCMNHEKTELLYEAEFRVTKRTDEPDSEERENGDIRQFTKTTIVVERVGDWWASQAARDAEPDEPNERVREWNVGKRLHQVKEGETVVFETPDKELADAIVDGAPIPLAA